jgi:elongation factor G
VKEYPTEKIRNIALIGHGTVGKTTLAEAVLFNGKAIPRIGSVGAGNAALDYTEAERRRKISIQLATGYAEWRETKINLVDTPGYDDFTGEVHATLRVADCCLLVLNAVAGVEPGAEHTFDLARARNLPTLIAVNMMDKEHADFDRVVAQAQDRLSPKAVPLQLPIGQGPDFRGLIDLFKMKAYIYSDASHEPKEEDIPADMVPRAQAARDALIEAVAEFDDAVIEKYLDGQALTREEILSALKLGVAKGGAYPVVVTSAEKNLGIRRMLDAFVVCFPSPAERPPVPALLNGTPVEVSPSDPAPSALVFKTVIEPHLGELAFLRVYSGALESASEVYNAKRNSSEKLGQLYLMQGNTRTEIPRAVAGEIVAAAKLKDTHTGDTLTVKSRPVVFPPLEVPAPVTAEAITPRKKGDEDKMGMAMHKIMEEDPTVKLEVDGELHQHVLRAMGELHMDVVMEKLRERHVEVELKKPRIHFRETINRKAEGQGKYKKQTGGRGQYGDVWLRLEPTGHGGGFAFEDEVVGGVVPGKFIPAVEKGVVEAMKEGVIAGYPVVDVRVTIFDGSHHSVDSSEMAFKVAGSMAFKKLMQEASPALLEPIAEVEVTVPEEYTGDIMGDLSSRRGKILGIVPQGKGQAVRALVPEAEMYRYSATLRSLTQGRGRFTMKYHAHEEVPRDQAERIIQLAKDAKEQSEGA